MMRKEKYQAIRTANVTRAFCFLTFPYLYNINEARQNVSTTSAIKGPAVIFFFFFLLIIALLH